MRRPGVWRCVQWKESSFVGSCLGNMVLLVDENEPSESLAVEGSSTVESNPRE